MRDALFPPNALSGDHVLLVRLRPSRDGSGDGEELRVEFKARRGTGAQHTRWCPTSLCYLRNRVDPQAFETAFAARLAATKDQKDPKIEREQFAALDGQRCFSKDAFGDPDAFFFELVSETRLPPSYLVRAAIEALSDKVKAFAKELRDLESTRLTVDALDVQDAYQLTLRDDDHTLGNLVQGLLYRRFVREQDSRVVSYLGYHKPHPLEHYIVFKVVVAETGGDVRELLAAGADWVVAHLGEVRTEWVKMTE